MTTAIFNRDIQTNLYSGIGSLSKCMEEAAKNGNNFFVAIDHYYPETNTQTKVYASFKDHTDFWSKTKHNVNPEPIPYYEIIPDNCVCNLFADLEWSLDWKTVDEIKEKVEELISNHTLLKNEAEYELVFLNASNQEMNKGSLHMHCNQICFMNIHDQLKFWNEIYVALEADKKWWFIDDTGKCYVMKTFVDFGVYNKNRNLRMIYSPKMKNGVCQRPLNPGKKLNQNALKKYLITVTGTHPVLDCSSLTAENKCSTRSAWSKTMVQHLVEKHGFEVTVENLKGNLIQLKNKTKTRNCNVCGTVHTDNAFLQIKGVELIYHCHFDKTKRQSKVIGRLNEDVALEPKIPFDRYLSEYRRVTTQEEYNVWFSRVMTDMNRYCAVVTVSSDPYVLYRDAIHEFEGEKIYNVYLAKSIKKFHLAFENMAVNTKFVNGVGSVRKRITELWCQWSGRTVKEGETCIPGKNVPHLVNTFQGLRITEAEAFSKVDIENDKSAQDFFHFFRKKACENEEQFDFLVRWLAHLIQKPGVRMLVAPVFKGNEGTGKGLLMSKMKEIIGAHNFLSPTSITQLEKYNSCIVGKLLVFMDEMTWGGNKSSEGWLKKFITDDTIVIDEKYVPSRQTDNICNVVFASNNEHVLPVSNSSRRIVVYEMKDSFKKLGVKEKALKWDSLWKTCPYAIARYLYKIDISEFRPSAENKLSTGLTHQKTLSLDPHQKWWVELLTRYLDQGNDGLYGNVVFGKSINKSALYEHYKSSNIAYPMIDVVFWKTIKKWNDDQPFIIKRECFSGGKKGQFILILPELSTCITNFNKFMNAEIIVQHEDS